MSISAWLRESAADERTPRENRISITLEAGASSSGGTLSPVTVHNISATGLLLECPEPLTAGEEISIDLPDASGTQARVVWTSGNLHGCEFVNRLSRATLSAAQLRGALGSHSGLAIGADSSTGEPLDARLQRLRKERGLTLAEVAQQLGVSKPTVWAWEQARSSPSPDRYDRIAEVLGTTASTLRSGRNEGAASDVLERSRRHIAKAYGVTVESVRIMIEL